MEFILIFIIIFLLSIKIFYVKEKFNVQSGVARGYSQVFSPFPRCLNSENCFAGSYFRSEVYNNICQPRCGELNREKRHLRDTCLRSL